MVRKISHDVAVAVASAGTGQTPLIFQEGIGEYLLTVGKDTVADTIGQLGEPFGLDLCAFPDIDLQLFVQFSIMDLYAPGGVGADGPTPNCSWQDLQKGWDPDSIAQRYGPELTSFTDLKFNDVVSVKNSDLGITIGAITKIDELTVAAKKAAELQRVINQGLKDT